MKFKRVARFVLVLFAVALYTEVPGQEISFKHIGTGEGLSQSSVSSVVQDKTGRIWMGTRDGLNMFDGSSIKTFRPVRGDSTSLLGHFITRIVPDGDNLWIISKSGVSRLNTEDQRFRRFYVGGVNTLVRYDGHIFLGTDHGIMKLDGNGLDFRPDTDLLKETRIVQDLYADDAGRLWMATDNGLYLYNPGSGTTRRILGINSTKIFVDSGQRIWIGTYNHGIYKLDSLFRTEKNIRSSGTGPYSLPSNTVRDIEEDDNGNIWIGTFRGLSILKPGQNLTVSNYTHDELNAGSLSHNSILCITRDRQGGMWLGTYFGGINYYHPRFNIFTSYPKVSEEAENKTLGFNVISEIREGDDGKVWIATEGGGVDRYDRKSGTFEHYRLGEEGGGYNHRNINVKALQFTGSDTLLVGTHLGGLRKLDTRTGRFRTYLPDPDDPRSIPSNIVEEIIPYKGDIYLLGTKEGVVAYNTRSEEFSPFIRDREGNIFRKRVNCLHIDRFGILWIGTLDEGLFAYDPHTRVLKTYEASETPNSISSNNISYIYEDHYFRLWFGTHGGGLNLYDREKDAFRFYNVENSSLSSNFIQGIEKSRQGNLWISTSKGISLFDLNSECFYNYPGGENGFPLKEPNHRALMLTGDGTLFVGGIDGLVSFEEREVFDNDSDFRLIFSALQVNNEYVIPGDSTGILKRDIAFTDSITLEPGQQFLKLQFSACNYVPTESFNYRYKLAENQEEWIDIRDQNNLTFLNLPPGVYTLRIQAVRNCTPIVIDETGLVITIQPPWYRRWYAIAGYILVSVCITGTLLIMYRNRVHMINELRAKQREKEQIQQLNQAKLKFFTKISHEFKTPLTIIMGLLETVLNHTREKDDNRQKISKSLDNVYRLDYLVNELLDFRKLESGHEKLRLERHDFKQLITYVYELFSETAGQKHIQYDLQLPAGAIVFVFDYRQLEKVFYNLVSNAFKFVEDEKGRIGIRVFVKEGKVITLVEDNGIGIRKEETQRIFDPYYQVENERGAAFGRSGIGLAISKEIVLLHQGSITADSEEKVYTVFRVALPLEVESYPETTEDREGLRNVTMEPPYLPPEDDAGSPSGGDGENREEGKEKILLVEDNPEVRRLVAEMLRPAYDVYWCDNGKQGLEMALQEEPDLIISDVMMPGMSGTEMCTVLKRNIETCHIPVILLTARSSVEARVEGFECGADEYLVKPFRVEILRARIRNMLNNRRLVQQRFQSDPNMTVKEVATNAVDSEFLEKARKIVEENLGNPDFNVQDFAGAMHLGKSKFYSKIKRITGQTPNDFVLSVRLKKAARLLLEHDDVMVSEVAYSVGYRDPRYFSKSFRQYFGVSPSHYGRESREHKRTEDGRPTGDAED